jgi:hypothetical protein
MPDGLNAVRHFRFLGSARALACWRSRLRDRELIWEYCFGEAPKPAREGACAPQTEDQGAAVYKPPLILSAGWRPPLLEAQSRPQFLSCIRHSAFDIRNSSGGIAQLVERQLCKLDVRGSNPLASKSSKERRFTNRRRFKSADRRPPLLDRDPLRLRLRQVRPVQIELGLGDHSDFRVILL